jgi:hypothetical protein
VRNSAIFACVLGFLTQTSPIQAQSSEERVHDVFITAGYSTLVGGCLGAALLGFADDPSSRLQYIAAGASLGFVLGSLFGSYVVFSPVLTQTDRYHTTPNLLAHAPNAIASSRDLFISPWINANTSQITGLSAAMTLAKF